MTQHKRFHAFLYGLIEETVDREALDIVGAWIEERIGGERAAPGSGPATASGAEGGWTEQP